MAGEIRVIEPKIQDFFAQLKGIYTLPDSISEDEIAKFCGLCDHHVVNGVCKIAGSNDQARYVARKGCGWASRNGTRGSMTTEGFQS